MFLQFFPLGFFYKTFTGTSTDALLVVKKKSIAQSKICVLGAWVTHSERDGETVNPNKKRQLSAEVFDNIMFHSKRVALPWGDKWEKMLPPWPRNFTVVRTIMKKTSPRGLSTVAMVQGFFCQRYHRHVCFLFRCWHVAGTVGVSVASRPLLLSRWCRW